jgi:hypothetical protein
MLDLGIVQTFTPYKMRPKTKPRFTDDDVPTFPPPTAECEEKTVTH